MRNRNRRRDTSRTCVMRQPLRDTTRAQLPVDGKFQSLGHPTRHPRMFEMPTAGSRRRAAWLVEPVSRSQAQCHGKRRDKPAWRWGWKEPYTEGVAIHGGPEPCVGDPRGRSEALDRGTHRPAIEPRNGVNRGADVVMTGGRPHRWWRYARAAGDPARSENLCMCGIFMPRTGRSHDCPPTGNGAGRSGKAEAARPRCTVVGSRTAS